MARTPEPLDVFPAYDAKRRSSQGLRKLIYRLSPFPLHTLHSLAFEGRLHLVRLKSRKASRRFEGSEELMVNIGPGPHAKPGWVNIDIFDGPNITCVYDCRKSLPFPDASVRGIFCEHVFEHIDYTEEAPYFLTECRRVLQPGGVLRIIVPDAGRYLKAYCEGGWEPLEVLRGLGSNHVDPHHGGHYATRMELINVIFRQGYEHKFAYDYETLEHILLTYGFSEVVRQSCGHSLQEGLAIDQPDRALESLYVDAVK